jgi:hypothetical protein
MRRLIAYLLILVTLCACSFYGRDWYGQSQHQGQRFDTGDN